MNIIFDPNVYVDGRKVPKKQRTFRVWRNNQIVSLDMSATELHAYLSDVALTDLQNAVRAADSMITIFDREV